MEILRGRTNVENHRTVTPPTSSEVYINNPDYCKGFAPAYYHKQYGWKYCGVCETLEEAATVFKEHKNLCNTFPEVFNWNDVTDMIIFRDNGRSITGQTNWFVCAVVLDR